ncbi:hypothetical protein DGWBC_0037 [Dehalogenimonas sp. WBC-2]|nr:hypothetical protein DGWBC_0037 [Dehalogenimonas sp. WBC-2]
MKNRFRPVVFTLLVLSIVLSLILPLSGCGGPSVTISTKLGDLALVKIWNDIVDSLDIQEDSAQLSTFTVSSDEDSNVYRFSLGFYGRDSKGNPKYYSASLNSDGVLKLNTMTTLSVPVFRHPLRIFSELDVFDLSLLEPGNGGLSIQVDFQNSDVAYLYQYVDAFELADGQLRQLEKISFAHSFTSCSITVFRMQSTDSGVHTTPPAPIPPGERTWQTWFLMEDINNATSVEYLEN